MLVKDNNLFNNICIVEVAGELGAYTGKLFADLGARVIRVETTDGDPTRLKGPFLKDTPGKENSLRYQYLNTGKQSVVVDISFAEGREVFRKLIKSADLLIESNPPGFMDGLGLGYKQLSKINPRLVYTAITPFGSTGPYKDFPFSDLTCLALGGMLYLAGVEDEKPARVPDYQSFFQADLYAAYGSIVALFHADMSGEGQFVDVSLHESVATALENAVQTYDLEGRIRRAAGSVEAGYGTYRCKDGYIYVMAAMGRNTYLWDPLVSWLLEEQIPEAQILADEQWRDPDFRKTPEAKEMFQRILQKFLRRYTKQELYEESQKRKVVIYPVNDAKDVVENTQLKHRNFFKELFVEHLKEKVFYPGAPYLLEAIPWEIKPAPLLGENTSAILKQMGYSEKDIDSLSERGVIYVK